ncbi:hypothetical protein [Bradyrhizobium valentinum]|uniref:hypothetical protein n=1 Tax=Bradyrhizobium valentinum TaxID=1518501 RepID=UPI0012E36CAF|nr:hypothetical protein [Bradyrhizobium valentinum]
MTALRQKRPVASTFISPAGSYPRWHWRADYLRASLHVLLRDKSASTTHDTVLDVGHPTSSAVGVAEKRGAENCTSQPLWCRISNDHDLKSQLNSFV